MSFYLLIYELLLLIFVVLQLKGENFPLKIFHHTFSSRKEVVLNIAFLNEQIVGNDSFIVGGRSNISPLYSG